MNNIYYVTLDENEEFGLKAVSLVDDPAIETNFLCFENEKSETIMFSKPEEHIITGVALRADMPVYRRKPDGTPFYIVWTKDVIKQFVERYAKKGMYNNVDLQHDGNMVDGVYMIESYFINDERGIRPSEFKDIENGSWIVSYYVEDEKLWNEIVNGNDLNGFSIKAKVKLFEEKFSNEKPDEFEDFLNELLKK